MSNNVVHEVVSNKKIKQTNEDILADWLELLKQVDLNGTLAALNETTISDNNGGRIELLTVVNSPVQRYNKSVMYPDEDEPQIDITKLRYVLYARKSTDDPKRQIRSINDQIDECKLLAERSGMRIVKVLKEEKSAKEPHKRKVFDEMMRGIESGKYDGVVAWNPDRLARNMIEGSHFLTL